jgi:Ca2+-binding EF-hand superfamily protein
MSSICKAFDKADTNKDGKLSKKEVMTAYNLKEEDVKKVFADFDFDKNGFLDYHEFKKWRLTLEFNEKDTNKNKTLEKKEIMDGYKLKKEQVDEIFNKYDLDKNGKLNFHEFKKWKMAVLLKEEFDNLDTNKDKKISKKEVQQGHKK